MVKITCAFRRTIEGRLAISFGADLLKLLSEGPNDSLYIFLNQGSSEAAEISSDSLSTAQILTEQYNRVLAEVAQQTGLPSSKIILTDQDNDGILIDHASAFERADLDVLYPSREKSLLARGSGPLLVPFGDSLSALPAANIAIMLAKKLALPVVFYHTTWIDESQPSTKAEDHMCNGARQVAALLKATADVAAVQYNFVVETADDVAEGILQCSLRQSVRLIVMPRSAKTTIGCYVNQALAKTPVPLLAVASKSGRPL